MAWTLFGRNWLTGIICMWHGLLVDVPNGWALCDGNNGTPDLREKFVRGSANGVNPGGIGGGLQHRHTVTGTTGDQNTEHTHQVEGFTFAPGAGAHDAQIADGSVQEYEFHTHEIDFESDTNTADHQHGFFDLSTYTSHLPPYYDIAFIMKL